MFPDEGQLAEPKRREHDGWGVVVEARPGSIIDLCGSDWTESAGVGGNSARVDHVGGEEGTGRAVSSRFGGGCNEVGLVAKVEVSALEASEKVVEETGTDVVGNNALFDEETDLQDRDKGASVGQVAEGLVAQLDVDGTVVVNPTPAASGATRNGDGSVEQDEDPTATGNGKGDEFTVDAEAHPGDVALNEAEPVQERINNQTNKRKMDGEGGESSKADEVAHVEGRKNRKKRKKSEKDPNKPKHPSSAYLFFSAAKRREIADRLGTSNDDPGHRLSKAVGETWNTMSDEEKAPYVRQAEMDKERYAREMKEYMGGKYGNPELKKGKASPPSDVKEPKKKRGVVRRPVQVLAPKEAGSDAEATRARRLRTSDIGPSIAEKELLVFWLDEFNDWFRAKVVSYNERLSIVHLYYPGDDHREALEFHEMKKLINEKRVRIVLDDSEETGGDDESDSLDSDTNEQDRDCTAPSEVNCRRLYNDWSDDETENMSEGDQSLEDPEMPGVGEVGAGRGDSRAAIRCGLDVHQSRRQTDPRGPGSKDAGAPAPVLDTQMTQNYELSITKDQSSKFEALKHIVLGEYFCLDSLSLGKAGSAFDWHDPHTGVKFARHDPIDKLLDEMVVGSALVYRLKKW